MSKWIIAGATSAMAIATARLMAARGYSLGLLGRDAAKLDIVAQDLKARGAVRVETVVWNAADNASTQAAFLSLAETLGGVDGLLVAHGTLSDQSRAQQDIDYALAEIQTNALSVIALCTVAANQMEAKRCGTIAVISSVAGDRGRQSNYVYGAAKSMVSTYLSGLRNRLFKAGVSVITIKPGFVDSPMTAHLAKGGPLWATPDQIGEGIMAAIDGKKDIVYLPWFWRFIMLIIQHIPETIFKRLNL